VFLHELISGKSFFPGGPYFPWARLIGHVLRLCCAQYAAAAVIGVETWGDFTVKAQ
jgi:hypothetical protein